MIRSRAREGRYGGALATPPVGMVSASSTTRDFTVAPRPDADPGLLTAFGGRARSVADGHEFFETPI